MELTDYRAQIDRIDRELVRLFAERMDTVSKIAAYKREHGLPVLDSTREQEKLQSVRSQVPEALSDDAERLFRLLLELSRNHQSRL